MKKTSSCELVKDAKLNCKTKTLNGNFKPFTSRGNKSHSQKNNNSKQVKRKMIVSNTPEYFAFPL